MDKINRIDNYADSFELNQAYIHRESALRAESSLSYGKKLEGMMSSYACVAVFVWAVMLVVISKFSDNRLFSVLELIVFTLVCFFPYIILKVFQRRHLRKPVEDRRTSGERAMLADSLTSYASAIIEAMDALNAELERWNAYVDALAAGMQSVTRDDEGLYTALISRREVLIAHAKKFTFLYKNRSTKTKVIGFPELAAKVSEAEKEFSAVEPAVTAKVYREEIQGPVSELEELRKSSGLSGVRVEAAAQKVCAAQEAEAEVVAATGGQVLVSR